MFQGGGKEGHCVQHCREVKMKVEKCRLDLATWNSLVILQRVGGLEKAEE